MASNNQTLACTYAALMLSDAGIPITAENIDAAVKAAGVEVRPTLPLIFARFLEKKPIEQLIAAASAVAPAVSDVPAAAPGGAPATGGKAKEEKVEEEDDDEMGFGLFD